MLEEYGKEGEVVFPMFSWKLLERFEDSFFS